MPFPASYPNWVFSLFSFIGFALVCIPFPWHFEAWNTGTCLYMAWTGLACLNQFINSIVWNRNAINWAPVWCDISAKFIVGTAVAIPAAALCINRRLYHIASVRSVTITKAEKRRGIMVDLAIGLGLPILQMILQYIPQGHRFDIYEDVGCWPFTYDTWVAYLLVSTPPILIGLVSGVYAVLSIRAFNKTRSQNKEVLSSYSNLTSSRYLRLMALGGCDVLCTVPLAIYATYLNAADGAIRPWISWQDTHAGFSRVDQIPAMLWRANPIVESALEMSRWLCVVCAVLFFAFFGFADEAKKNYRSAISSVAKRVGMSTGSFGNSSGIVSSSEMSKSGIGSQPGSFPGFGEKYGRRNSYEVSFTDVSSSLRDVEPSTPAISEKKNSSFTSVFSTKKKFNEEVFKPTFQYDDLVLPDIGGTLADHDSGEISPVPSSGSSSASSISIPEPVVTRSEAGGPDVASFRHASRNSFVSDEPRRNSHDMV